MRKSSRRVWFALAGGISVTSALWLVNILGALLYEPAMDFSFKAIFWSAGIFSGMFDTLTGTESVWIPHPLALLASIALSVLIYSIPVYAILTVFAYRGNSN